jgi:hypothetical protein
MAVCIKLNMNSRSSSSARNKNFIQKNKENITKIARQRSSTPPSNLTHKVNSKPKLHANPPNPKSQNSKSIANKQTKNQDFTPTFQEDAGFSEEHPNLTHNPTDTQPKSESERQPSMTPSFQELKEHSIEVIDSDHHHVTENDHHFPTVFEESQESDVRKSLASVRNSLHGETKETVTDELDSIPVSDSKRAEVEHDTSHPNEQPLPRSVTPKRLSTPIPSSARQSLTSASLHDSINPPDYNPQTITHEAQDQVEENHNIVHENVESSAEKRLSYGNEGGSMSHRVSFSSISSSTKGENPEDEVHDLKIDSSNVRRSVRLAKKRNHDQSLKRKRSSLDSLGHNESKRMKRS